ncbi:uncharacterized protein [Penaeus vannamei]|uniref:uncharacterized protein n=1 Tax=Penaeus vannamei TaxID=6689 RepID=UPI00387F69F1
MEGLVNVSVTAINLFESVTLELFFEISGIVRGLELFDFGEVKPMGHVQTVQVNLYSLGVGTCLMIAWGDKTQFEFMGEEAVCASKYEMEYFSNRPLELQMNFTHVYMPLELQINFTHVYM